MFSNRFALFPNRLYLLGKCLQVNSRQHFLRGHPWHTIWHGSSGTYRWFLRPCCGGAQRVGGTHFRRCPLRNTALLHPLLNDGVNTPDDVLHNVYQVYTFGCMCPMMYARYPIQCPFGLKSPVGYVGFMGHSME